MNKKAQGYKYTVADNNIKVYYPKELSRQKGIQIENTNAYEFGLYTEEVIQPEYVIKDNFIHCEKPMILYKDAIDKQCDVFFYPSSIGTNCEITFNRKPISNEINFWFKSEDEIKLKKEPGGYISLSKTINQKNIIVGVIQPPLLENEQGDVTFENEVRFVKEKNGTYLLSFSLCKDYLSQNSKAYLSFEMRREKQPDNAIYSEKPNLRNAYLLNYATIGNSSAFGVGRLMIRFEFCDKFGFRPKNIKKVNFDTYNLSKNTINILALSILEDWCSIAGNWNSNYKLGGMVAASTVKDSVLSFDITEEVKEWCDDEDKKSEKRGILLKAEDEKTVGKNNIILSNDNALYPTKTEIVLE